MDRLKLIKNIRKLLSQGSHTIGSWIQIPDNSIAEIMGQSGYDWVAVDMEHGSISIECLPDLFRALELGSTLPLVRLSEGTEKNCKQALDAGAGGVIVPMINSADQLSKIISWVSWPPAGKRGVGFSRANLFGKFFERYTQEAQHPLVVAMIESKEAVEDLDKILAIEGLDAIMIGPYDLSASINVTGKFSDDRFESLLSEIREKALKYKIACGIHVVSPDEDELKRKINEGFQFIAYSLDSVFLINQAKNPLKK